MVADMLSRVSNLSFGRRLTSYSLVQENIGRLMRNNKLQLSNARIKGLSLLDVGCGQNFHKHMINLDYNWQPGVDLCWDVTKGIPYDDGRLTGIFSEHCLEHLALEKAEALLRECRRVLADGGVIRIVVPDAERYLLTYARRMSGDGEALFPFEGIISYKGIRSPILYVNAMFYRDRDSPFGHRFIYDGSFLIELLRLAGFSDAYRCAINQGRMPELILDTPRRGQESLYVEGIA